MTAQEHQTMAYTEKNYQTKKAFMADFKAGVKIRTYSPGPFPVTQNGRDTIEGPHYPQPHKFYIAVEVQDGIIVKAK